MINIIKAKSHMISKLFIYHFAMSLFGVFVISPFFLIFNLNGNGKIGESSCSYVYLAVSVFAMLFYYSLVAFAVIEDGQKDYISHNAGHGSCKWYAGFIYGVVSYLPTIIFVLLDFIISIISDGEISNIIFLFIKLFFVRVFTMGQYFGLEVALLRVSKPILPNAVQQIISNNDFLFVLCLVLLPLVTGISYYLAFKGKVHVDTKVKERKK